MASPFGLFLYSFYDPFLAGMRKSTLTAWVAAFFLPQAVYQTSSPFIDFIRWYGQYFFYLGLLGFFIFAIQIYWAKLKRKGMVSSFVYSYIRHPQYLFFMLSGAGLLFMWPRMMMLVLFATMGIVYFYLAKFEENKMLAQHPEYAEYMRNTAMFIPGNPGGRIYKLLLGRIPNQKLGQVISVALIVCLTFGGAIGLRNYSITSLSTAELVDNNVLIISIFPHNKKYMRNVVNKSIAHESIHKALSDQGNVSYTAHILPINYGMLGKFSEINAETREIIVESFHNRSSLRDWLWGTETDEVKIVFSKIDKPGKTFVPLNEILDMSAKMTPVLTADLNAHTGELLNLSMTSTTYYGDVPQPIF